MKVKGVDGLPSPKGSKDTFKVVKEQAPWNGKPLTTYDIVCVEFKDVVLECDDKATADEVCKLLNSKLIRMSRS